MAEYSYTVFFEPAEEGGFVATCPALPGLVTAPWRKMPSALTLKACGKSTCQFHSTGRGIQQIRT